MCLWEVISALMEAFQERKPLRHSGKVKGILPPLLVTPHKGPKQADWLSGLPTLHPQELGQGVDL